MAVNSQNVYVGKPDQATTGAVATAAVGTTAPTTASEVLPAAWTHTGYVGEDGLTVTLDRSTTELKDWAGSNVRVLLDEFKSTVQYTEMETSYESMCRMVGEDNVTKTDATSSAGTKMKVSFGPTLPPARAFCFSMKDEDRRIRVYIPNGQLTEVDNVSFVRNEAVKWTFTIEANDDGTGHSIYLLTDDGAPIDSDTDTE